MTNATTTTNWPTAAGYDLAVDAQESTTHLRYTNPTTARTVTIAFTYDHGAKAYTTHTALTSPRNSAHYGTRGAETRRADNHTAEQFRAYVADQVESGWLAETVEELAERATEILPARLELVDDVDQRPTLV